MPHRVALQGVSRRLSLREQPCFVARWRTACAPWLCRHAHRRVAKISLPRPLLPAPLLSQEVPVILKSPSLPFLVVSGQESFTMPYTYRMLRLITVYSLYGYTNGVVDLLRLVAGMVETRRIQSIVAWQASPFSSRGTPWPNGWPLDWTASHEHTFHAGRLVVSQCIFRQRSTGERRAVIRHALKRNTWTLPIYVHE